jgi:RNA polymerase sigma factor (sigma-70 family)
MDRSEGTHLRELSWPDKRLVRECLGGNEQAWAALVAKYKNLIFSVPIKLGIPRDDAGEILQRVCLLLMAELPNVREAKTLTTWLMGVTSDECLRWRRQEHPYAARETAAAQSALLAGDRPLAEELLAQVEAEQRLRDAMRALPARCRQLIDMFLSEAPARPDQEIARSLGLAPGSIPSLRGRCLKRLRRELEEMGFR